MPVLAFSLFERLYVSLRGFTQNKRFAITQVPGGLNPRPEDPAQNHQD